MFMCVGVGVHNSGIPMPRSALQRLQKTQDWYIVLSGPRTYLTPLLQSQVNWFVSVPS